MFILIFWPDSSATVKVVVVVTPLESLLSCLSTKLRPRFSLYFFSGFWFWRYLDVCCPPSGSLGFPVRGTQVVVLSSNFLIISSNTPTQFWDLVFPKNFQCKYLVAINIWPGINCLLVNCKRYTWGKLSYCCASSLVCV